MHIHKATYGSVIVCDTDPARSSIYVFTGRKRDGPLGVIQFGEEGYSLFSKGHLLNHDDTGQKYIVFIG